MIRDKFLPSSNEVINEVIVPPLKKKNVTYEVQ